MKKTNKYGFISGGYIFDLLDRAALEYINFCYPETEKQQIYTQWCEINFNKQLCQPNGIKVKTDKIEQRIIGELWVVDNSLWQGNTVIAHAEWWFKKTKHNYCEQKEK